MKQIFAVAALAFGIAAGVSLGHAGCDDDVVDKVAMKEQYDLRHFFPAAPPSDVTGIEATFTGHRGSATTARTLQLPCNVFKDRGAGDNAEIYSSAFGMKLSPEANRQFEDLLVQTQYGLCASTLQL